MDQLGVDHGLAKRFRGSAQYIYGARACQSSSFSWHVGCTWLIEAVASGGACGSFFYLIRLIFAPWSLY